MFLLIVAFSLELQARSFNGTAALNPAHLFGILLIYREGRHPNIPLSNQSSTSEPRTLDTRVLQPNIPGPGCHPNLSSAIHKRVLECNQHTTAPASQSNILSKVASF